MAKEIGYRTETFFGEGYRNAASVMAHKTFVLDNTDILSYLIDSDLIDQGTKDYLQVYVALMEEGRLIYTGYATDYEEMLYRYRKNEEDRIEFFQEVLDDIKSRKGIDVNYVLWLCDSPEDAFNSYNIEQNISMADVEFDGYLRSNVILSDIETEGKLYGYEKEPKPVTRVRFQKNGDAFIRKETEI